MAKKKISADLSIEAYNLLDGLVIKHERPRGWLLSKMILKFTAEQGVKEKPAKQANKSKAKSYPGNLDEQFEILWGSKGKKGSRKKAKECYKKIMVESSDSDCESVTDAFIKDMKRSANEPGFEALHLTTYLNEERWVK